MFKCVATVLTLAIIAAGCGSSSSSSSSKPAITPHDAKVGAAMSKAQAAWDAAYARWDHAYYAGQSNPFLAAAHRTEPQLTKAASDLYTAAITTDDPQLRHWNVKLARLYLAEVSGIHLADFAVQHNDQADLARGIHELDNARKNELTVAEDFVNFAQRRYGVNPLAAR